MPTRFFAILLAVTACADDALRNSCEDPPCGEAFTPAAPAAESCGNGVLDAGEACDTAIASSDSGACPSACTPINACFSVALQGEGCAQRCVVTQEITAPIPGDGCCPAGATPSHDNDCGTPIDPPTCGNGLLDPGERCDSAALLGDAAACPTICAPTNACTTSLLVGEGCARHCQSSPVVRQNGDGCCISPADAGFDNDCPGLPTCKQPSQSFAAREAWRWDNAPTLLNMSGTTLTTPVVAQFTDDNGDGNIDNADVPDVLVVIAGMATLSVEPPNGLPSTIVLLSGDSGAHHWYFDGTVLGLNATVSPAVGDVDGDGSLDMVFATTTSDEFVVDGLVVLRRDRSLLFSTEVFDFKTSADALGAPSLADLDHDGRAEIVFGNNVFDHTGQLRWSGSDIVPPPQLGRMSLVVELGGRPGMEVLDGGTAYSADGQLYFEYTGVGFATPAVADCDGDGQPEILLAGQPSSLAAPSLVLLNSDGSVRVGPVSPGGLRPNSPIAAGDLDGDGRAEFVAAATTSLIGLDCTLQIVMRSDLIIDYSGASGPVLFDFDGDGALEIVYGDELRAYVFSGTGQKLWDVARVSRTGLDTPVVADIDGDGEAEILVPQARAVPNLPAPQGVIAYESAASPWSRTLPIWNQHTFHGTNVFADGAIPVAEGAYWSTFNGLRANIALAPVGGCD